MDAMTVSRDRHIEATRMDAKMPAVLAQEHRTWAARVETTKVRAQTWAFREQRALRGGVLAGNCLGPARLGGTNGAYGHGASARTGGMMRCTQSRSTDPRCQLDFGLVPTMHRADKRSSALERCERALSKVPEGWLVSPTHQTRADKHALAERDRAACELAETIRAKAQLKREREIAARAAEVEAEEKKEAQRQAQDEELARLREDVVAWRRGN